jgi:hypothetical protein
VTNDWYLLKVFFDGFGDSHMINKYLFREKKKYNDILEKKYLKIYMLKNVENEEIVLLAFEGFTRYL